MFSFDFKGKEDNSLNSFMSWTGFYMISASVVKGLNFLNIKSEIWRQSLNVYLRVVFVRGDL